MDLIFVGLVYAISIICYHFQAEEFASQELISSALLVRPFLFSALSFSISFEFSANVPEAPSSNYIL